MIQESLILSAAEIDRSATRAGVQLLELIAQWASDPRPVLLHIEYPGKANGGGVVLTPRRMTWVSRWCWKRGTRAMRVGL